MAENLSEKYKVKDEIEHILDRSGMWLGSTETETKEMPLYMPSKDIISYQTITHNAGLLKIIDEVVSNSIDEYRRSKMSKKDSLFEISTIKVVADENGSICISDDGGIPVVKHETGLYVPELIFGQLRSSSNYEDNDDREVVGTNGLGAKLTNIFSKSFTVETADGKNKFVGCWSDNMRVYDGGKIEPCKEHYTRISFDIDLKRFDKVNFNDDENIEVVEKMPTGTIRSIQKRCMDAAAANSGLTVEFESDLRDGILNSKWRFEKFEDYARLYFGEDFKTSMKYVSRKDNIIIIPIDQNSKNVNVGFVNGAICSDGTHMKKVEKQITDKMLEFCAKDDMELITEKDITNRMVVFVNCTVINPKYDSQSKDKLTNKLDRSVLLMDESYLNSLKDSELYNSIKTYYDVKYAVEKKKELKKLNGLIKATKTKKLIQSASKDVSTNELWLFEGNSAGNGFRRGRDLHQAAYLLRGKIVNTFNLSKSQILENLELREVLAVCDLQFNEPAKNIKSFKFHRLVLSMDMDVDGHHICGLFLAFFAKHFPELFKIGKIYRSLSPIIIATKQKDIQRFFSLGEYHKEESKLKGYDIIYTKGLGGLSVIDYKEMLRNPKLIKFDYREDRDMETIGVWFDKSTEIRKKILSEDMGIDNE